MYVNHGFNPKKYSLLGRSWSSPPFPLGFLCTALFLLIYTGRGLSNSPRSRRCFIKKKPYAVHLRRQFQISISAAWRSFFSDFRHRSEVFLQFIFTTASSSPGKGFAHINFRFPAPDRSAQSHGLTHSLVAFSVQSAPLLSVLAPVLSSPGRRRPSVGLRSITCESTQASPVGLTRQSSLVMLHSTMLLVFQFCVLFRFEMFLLLRHRDQQKRTLRMCSIRWRKCASPLCWMVSRVYDSRLR